MSFKWLRGALETIANDNIPNWGQKRSITEFVDKFISCSLQEPMTRDIALLVQQHRHSRSCERPGTNCRFNFPQLPSLYTLVAVPTRITCKEIEERRELHNHIKVVLGRVRKVLETEEAMERINSIRQKDIETLFEYKTIMERTRRLIEDPHFRDQIIRMKPNKKSDLFTTKKFGERNVDNLRNLYAFYEAKVKELTKRVPDWREERLLAVLYEADILRLLEIEQDLEFEERDPLLLKRYHNLLSHSMKGYAIVLKRDVDEVWTNSVIHEWLEVWNSNIDVQIALDMYAIVTYITDYYLKVIFLYNGF